jgi:hypothetical protein
VHTSARQFAPPFLSFPAYVHVCHSRLPFPVHIGARRSRCEGCIWLSPAHRVPLRLPSRVEKLSRLLRRTGRVGRCSPRTHPCMSLPNARSLEACLAVQWLPVTLPLRPSLPWPQLRPHSPSPEPLALGSACLCDRAGLLDARVVAHGGVGSGAQVRCCLRARWDRVSGGTLGGGPEGSVQPRSGALRARLTSWESSGALERMSRNRSWGLWKV